MFPPPKQATVNESGYIAPHHPPLSLDLRLGETRRPLNPLTRASVHPCSPVHVPAPPPPLGRRPGIRDRHYSLSGGVGAGSWAPILFFVVTFILGSAVWAAASHSSELCCPHACGNLSPWGVKCCRVARLWCTASHLLRGASGGRALAGRSRPTECRRPRER